MQVAGAAFSQRFTLQTENDLHERHAGLNKSVSTIHIDLKDFVHVSAHIQANATWHTGGSPTVPNIAADLSKIRG